MTDLKRIGVHGPWFAARRTWIRAGLAALDDRPFDALALYRDAIRGLHDLDVPLDEAFTVIEMATLPDPAEPEVQAAADAAREILTRLRAQPFLDRLGAALTRKASPARGSADVGTLVETPAKAR